MAKAKKESQMNDRLALLILLFLSLTLFGCSGGNSAAPAEKSAHPIGWIVNHPASALAAANFSDCTVCHGSDLQGSGEVISCFSCHSFNTTPTFIIHPAEWDETYTSHRSYAAANGFTTCANCHGTKLKGSPAAPSCFSSSFDGRNCHPAGPGEAPHPVDGTYLDGTNHGPDAKANLTSCQSCHGQPGGPGNNPRFNSGIKSQGGTGCEACHGVNYAHPALWAGPNNAFHYSAGSIQSACTLCHGVNLDGNGGVGVSCLDCHVSTTTFTLDCTSCHAYPPEGSPDFASDTGVDHKNAADVSPHDVCVLCHGMKESDTGGSFSATTNYLLFDKSTDTLGSHWNGAIDMNSDADYNQTTFGCSSGCHISDLDHQLSDSGLTVELTNFGFGEAVPHSLDGSFFEPLNHGQAAKGLSAAFPDGMVDCQPCHATPPFGNNPRFNVGIVRVGSNGCEACHNTETAHPSNGVRDRTHWYDNTFTHSDTTDFTTICSPCHGDNLNGPAGGGVGPACIDCHSVSPVSNPSGCVSCHNLPPDGGAPAGTVRPNRQGQHNRAGHSSLINADSTKTCVRCHKGVGVGTAAHFDTTGSADVNFLHPDATDTITPISTGVNTTCNGVCHITTDAVDIPIQHTNASWY